MKCVSANFIFSSSGEFAQIVSCILCIPPICLRKLWCIFFLFFYFLKEVTFPALVLQNTFDFLQINTFLQCDQYNIFFLYISFTIDHSRKSKFYYTRKFQIKFVDTKWRQLSLKKTPTYLKCNAKINQINREIIALLRIAPPKRATIHAVCELRGNTFFRMYPLAWHRVVKEYIRITHQRNVQSDFDIPPLTYVIPIQRKQSNGTNQNIRLHRIKYIRRSIPLSFILNLCLTD